MVDAISKVIAFLIVLILRIIIYPIYIMALVSESVAKFVADTCRYMLDKLENDNNSIVIKDDTTEKVIDSI